MSRLEQINASHVRQMMHEREIDMHAAKHAVYLQAALDDVTAAQTVDDLKPVLFWLIGKAGLMR